MPKNQVNLSKAKKKNVLKVNIGRLRRQFFILSYLFQERKARLIEIIWQRKFDHADPAIFI